MKDCNGEWGGDALADNCGACDNDPVEYCDGFPTGITALTDNNFSTAVSLWFSDESSATATYGHISNWDMSAVSNMAYAFKDRASFNEDISSWDVSNVTNMGNMFRGSRF